MKLAYFVREEHQTEEEFIKMQRDFVYEQAKECFKDFKLTRDEFERRCIETNKDREAYS